MRFFKLDPLEYRTSSGKGAASIYVNLDHVVYIREDAPHGGHFVLTGGATYFLDRDVFGRLMKAMESK
jgi:hypothetical protein